MRSTVLGQSQVPVDETLAGFVVAHRIVADGIVLDGRNSPALCRSVGRTSNVADQHVQRRAGPDAQ